MTFTKTLLASLLAALTIATGTASADGGPGIMVGSGCTAQCIKKALVTVTATTAKVELETTVLAHLKIYVAKKGASNGSGGGLVANQTMLVSISAFDASKTAWFTGLDPDTVYSITVQATDLQNRKASQKGTFKTLPIKKNGPAGPGSIDSGLGCAAECIERALFTQTKPQASIANADFRTAVDAHISVVVSRDKDAFEIVSSQHSPGFVREWKTQVGGLDLGTVYHVAVRAMDRQGRTSVRKGTFKTVSASALVTLHKIKVLNDGDKWGKGELYFDYWGGGKFLTSQGYQKIDSGSVVNTRTRGTTRPGVIVRLPANGDARLSLFVAAQECDAVLMKNCVVEATNGPFGDAVAGGNFDLSDILAGGASWPGTGVTAPAGHDGYFVFGTTQNYVKFLVLATVDVDVNWP